MNKVKPSHPEKGQYSVIIARKPRQYLFYENSYSDYWSKNACMGADGF